jgi:hypothetical protein
MELEKNNQKFSQPKSTIATRTKLRRRSTGKKKTSSKKSAKSKTS